MEQITQMDLINAMIEYGAKGTSNKDITKNILSEWRDSQTIKDMIEAEKYYKVQNTTIDNKTRSYADEDGKLINNEFASNVKTKTARYRKSVNQKVNFALMKPFIISCDNDNYKKQWEEFLTDDIRATIQRAGKDGINKGIGWIYPWINEDGILDIVDVEPEIIYPAWQDTAHTKLDVVVRDYTVTKYENQTKQDIRKVEYWDKNIVEKYIDYSIGNGTGDLQADTDDLDYQLSDEEKERATIQQSHLTKQDGSSASWERVPFIFFKGCDDELTLLNECRTDVDGYDMLKSKALDSLADDIDPTVVIEGIGSEMGELVKARKLIQNSRIIALDPGGKADVLKVNTDISQVIQQLELLKKDILDNTNTVDLTTIQLGTNPSGNAMKSFYESLNTWCNGFEAQFRVFMKNLKYFFDKWLSWKGGFGTFEQLQAIPITFTLDRDMMINETEIIDNVVKLHDIISEETLDEMNPWVENHQKEQQRREEDDKRAQEKMELYQFENTADEDDGTDEENINQTIDKDKDNKKSTNEN